MSDRIVYQRKKSSGWFWKFLAVVIVVAIAVVLWFGVDYVTKLQQPQSHTPAESRLTDLEEEVGDLRLQVSAGRWAEVLKWLIIIGGPSLVGVFWIHKKSGPGVLRGDVHKLAKKLFPRVKELTGREPLWYQVNSFERKKGRPEYVLIQYVFHKKIPGEGPRSSLTKILAVEMNAESLKTVEGIPVGYTLQQAVKWLHDIERHGFTMQRDELHEGAEFFDRFVDARQKTDEVLDIFNQG